MKESQLDNKTAIATNDYVRMVDENGNSVKIKKDSFMAAIRDALPSIISDGETGGGSVLSIINGALKTRTDANLASVLGVKAFSVSTWNTEDEYISKGGITPAPYHEPGYGYSMRVSAEPGGIEIALFKNGSLYGIRIRGVWDNAPTPWVDIKQIE